MTASFPPLTKATVLAFQTSSWLDVFSSVTIKTSIIRPLPADFRQYLESDGITIPEGSENLAAQSSLSDDESEQGSEEASDNSEPPAKYSFPELDAQIRLIMAAYGGAVFPKLNWTAPKDAAWMLNPSSPLKCTSPSDVYLYLKSSDFIGHDLDPEMVFDGCVDAGDPEEVPYELELVLKKWYPIDRSREMRCFVRDDNLIDVFDILLTRSLESAHLIDFNPYAPRTDALLFTYEELHVLGSSPLASLPELRVIPSSSHPMASRNAPAHQHNMVPREALELSHGRDIQEFHAEWMEQVQAATKQD
ncbi:hypothetical protein FRC04_002206 [Tulasnella sp. 424]|nr:hypothetical protein FRC04_002206 [Tulasnella sp. 424]KAG8967752.1 hypothetical protein FRC05_001931 [Tulasnella sp. 425]